jgi:S-adenosylmethionine:tRNA ribosyltransferase-isomerase
MRVDEFDFHLPPELIAQQPSAFRDSSRLLVMDRTSGAVSHRQFSDLFSLLRAGDLLVVNDTRVFPARLIGTREPGGGAAECFLVRPVEGDTWTALVHPGQRLKEGSRMRFAAGAKARALHGEVVALHFHRRRTVKLWTEDGSPVRDAIDAIGHVPLPPYIKRGDTDADRERYQTIYARERGSIAAPTAGLHFTPALFKALDERGVTRVPITLHVGYGTFQPVRVDRVEDHEVEAEHYEVGDDTARQLSAAHKEGRRIIAVGTTTTRTLESLSIDGDGNVLPGSGETSLFIHPGHRFRLVSGLITNFHLPKSSLLMLVSAFAGVDHVRDAYREAVEKRYRFYSYGDAMFIG